MSDPVRTILRWLCRQPKDLAAYNTVYMLTKRFIRGSSHDADKELWDQAMEELERFMPTSPAEVEFLRQARKYYHRYLLYGNEKEGRIQMLRKPEYEKSESS